MTWLLPLIIIAVIVPLLTAGFLLKKWSMEQADIDIREEKLDAEDLKEDVEQFTPEQKAALTLLLTPPVLFVVMIIMYIAANIAAFE